MTEWPDPWISAAERECGITNDHGILYLCGEVQDGEWLHTMEQLPPHLENRC